jgi:hypothetical protein
MRKMMVGIGTLLLMGTACQPSDTYPIEPVITYNQMIVQGDSLRLDVNFTDGDGDIGLTTADTTGVHGFGQTYYYNLFAEYWEWNHHTQQWQKGQNLNGDDIEFNFRIPYITPGGRNKTLKGVIKATIEPIYYNPLSVYSDTIRYRVMLVDRALHESEWIYTAEIWNGVVQP